MSLAAVKTGLHPLDPLTRKEVQLAGQVCKQYASKKGVAPLRFNTVTLKEPVKGNVLKHKRCGISPPREALCIIQSPRDQKSFEAIVSLQAECGEIKEWKELEQGTQPLASPDDCLLAEKIVQEALCIIQSPRDQKSFEAIVSLQAECGEIKEWKELEQGTQPLASPDDCLLAEKIVQEDTSLALFIQERYGLKDMSQLVVDPWSVHSSGLQSRCMQTFLYYSSFPNDNAYAHPLDIVPVVDLNEQKIIRIDKPTTLTDIPAKNVNYHRDHAEVEFRKDLKPLNIVQPEGPSFKLDGNRLEWQKWSMRIGFNYREGLVLHDVGYQDSPQSDVRPVLHRASLVEMCVPYGDPREPFVRKCAFDVGDYGLGNCTNSLELGCDCLGNIQYLDVVLSDSAGDPWEIKKAICIHEEDRGLLWKHLDYRTGYAESRRSRVLVISFIATVVNYEYLFYWYFYQDGTIEYEIKLSGELSTNVLSSGETKPEYGTLVSPGVNAQFHQHLFCARLDVAVGDKHGGKGLQICEVDVEAMVQDEVKNPWGNGFKTVETILTTEQEAQRVTSASKNRIWRIVNPNQLNPITGDPIAYCLMPSVGQSLLAAHNSLVAKKGRFAEKNLWVTPYDEEQQWPAGDYPMQSEGEQGLPLWTSQDRSLVGEDVVLWHTFGVTHIPRPEDFPVMPVEKVGFTLKPFGFFAMNPAVDIPPITDSASRQVCCNGSA
eukprot:TRINITY_DN9016_c0_g2_i1.p1 TRINITY_DN9016_c0_g2~~TRINITY_DN9016_c0_g2_i1.p1  ORF type:complete len:714 (+),score=119.60 TRINITY_DN9016_c0_g2_i1:60-2201(+)